jgi:insulysin
LCAFLFLSKANYEEVALAIFKYITLLKSQSPQEWAFREVAMVSEIDFRFMEMPPPSHYVTTLSGNMHQPYPRQWILSAPYFARQFDSSLISRTLDFLKPENVRMTVASQTELPGRKYESKEKWYGTEYTVTPMRPELLKVRCCYSLWSLRTLKSSSFQEAAETRDYEDLSLPKPNAFIPSNLDVLARPEPDKTVECRYSGQSWKCRVDYQNFTACKAPTSPAPNRNHAALAQTG